MRSNWSVCFHLKCRKLKLGASKSKRLCADKLEQAEIGDARNLSREERKGRGGHGKEKVGEKRCFRDTCDTGAVEGATKGRHGEEGGAGGEKLSNKRTKEAKHKPQSGCQGKGKKVAVEKSSRKEGLKHLTSTLLWDLRNEAGRDYKLTPALDQRVDKLKQKLLATYCTQGAGWYSENFLYNQAFQGLACDEEQEEQEAVVEEGTRDSMSLDAHNLPPDLGELEPVCSSSLSLLL